MRRRSLITLITTVAGLAAAAPASAAICTPTDYMQDGRPLTAALVNPPAVTGTVDATGCDIAVYFSSGAHTVSGAADIKNAFYYGVLTRNAGTSATITDTQVHNIGDGVGGNFLPTGAQHGVAVAYREGATGSVTWSDLYAYQKGGAVVTGAGTRATVADSTVTGLGPVSYIAQNGVQFSFGAAGEARGNLIRNHQYTGPQDTFSTGLLLYDVDPSNVKRSLNLYRDNDRNEIVVPSASLK